jgi:hypothetical protein
MSLLSPFVKLNKLLVTALMFALLPQGLVAQEVTYLSLITAQKLQSDLSPQEIANKYLEFIDPQNLLSEAHSITEAKTTIVKDLKNGKTLPAERSVTYKDDSNRIAVIKTNGENADGISKSIWNVNSGYTLNGDARQFLGEHDVPPKKFEITNLDYTKEVFPSFKEFPGLYVNYDDYQPILQELEMPKEALSYQIILGDKTFYAIEYTIVDRRKGRKYLDGFIETTFFYDPNTFELVYSISNYQSVLSSTRWLTQYDGYKLNNGLNMATIRKTIEKKSVDSSFKISQTYSHSQYSLNESFSRYIEDNVVSIAKSLPLLINNESMNDEDFTQSHIEIGDSSYLSIKNAQNSSNKRELIYERVLADKNYSLSDSIYRVLTNFDNQGSTNNSKRIRKMNANIAGKLKYRRSSLYTIMIEDTTRERHRVIKDAFGNSELSEKFNDHNIGPYLIAAHGQSGEKDQTALIESYLNKNGVARDLVAKWFNRDSNGKFNMDLIAERGQYNASELDIQVAQSSVRGIGLLADAGRELIGNTFLIVYDYDYTNKEEQAKNRGGFIDAVSAVASIAGYDDVANIAQGARLVSDVVGKGYFVRTTSYLYRLVWNEEIANEFYTKMWMDESDFNPDRKIIFDQTDLFKLEFVGSVVSRNNLQSTIFTSKSDDQLIEIATTRAIDKNIGKLQRTYEEFRIKTPLFSIEPIAAQIGTKEDIEPGDKFEVLEQVLSEDGTTYYDKVGTIKVSKDIWDNAYKVDNSVNLTYSYQLIVDRENINRGNPGINLFSATSPEESKLAQEWHDGFLDRGKKDHAIWEKQIADKFDNGKLNLSGYSGSLSKYGYYQKQLSFKQQLTQTIFKGNSKNFAPGMLIRQIN